MPYEVGHNKMLFYHYLLLLLGVILFLVTTHVIWRRAGKWLRKGRIVSIEDLVFQIILLFSHYVY